MLKVIIPNICIPEIEYVFNCLLNEFLGINYTIVHSIETKSYKLEYNEKSISIDNQFFLTDNIEELLVENKIPNLVDNTSIAVNGKKFPHVALYGQAELSIDDNVIYLKSDIVASTFFMLSRWEEYAIVSRDQHNRFDHTQALSIKHNFIERPIVNEYIVLLSQLLRHIGFDGDFKNREFRLFPTHDVDSPYMWKSANNLFRSFAGKILKGRLKESINNLRILAKGKDPYDTFDYMMDLSDKANTKSYFFFMSGGQTSFDNRYSLKDKFVQKLLRKIENRNHIIGFHPSYNAYNDSELFRKEKELLEHEISGEVLYGRQHYLRFENPSTWTIWNDEKMKWDSTMSYAQKAGFRSGVCYEYPVFDILGRKELSLREKPLIAMEVSLLSYQNLTITSAIKKVRQLKSEVKTYSGDFVFLWHNSSFNTREWFGTERVLAELYKN